MSIEPTPNPPPRKRPESPDEKAKRLAAEQGVKPVTIRELIDRAEGIWPEGESVDDFLEEIYRARR